MPMAVGRKKRMIWWPYPIYYGGSDAGQIFSVSLSFVSSSKIVSEYDQEIPQSQIADNPVAPQGRAAQPPRHTRKTN